MRQISRRWRRRCCAIRHANVVDDLLRSVGFYPLPLHCRLLCPPATADHQVLHGPVSGASRPSFSFSLAASFFILNLLECHRVVQKESGQPKKGSINDSVDPVYSTDDVEVVAGASQQKKVHYFSLMKRIWREALVVFTVFFVSLSLFPGTTLPITTMSLAPRWWLLSHIWFGACLTQVDRLSRHDRTNSHGHPLAVARVVRDPDDRILRHTTTPPPTTRHDTPPHDQPHHTTNDTPQLSRHMGHITRTTPTRCTVPSLTRRPQVQLPNFRFYRPHAAQVLHPFQCPMAVGPHLRQVLYSVLRGLCVSVCRPLCLIGLRLRTTVSRVIIADARSLRCSFCASSRSSSTTTPGTTCSWPSSRSPTATAAVRASSHSRS